MEFPWKDNPTQVERLKQLRAEGHSFGMIASIMTRDLGCNITRNSVISTWGRANGTKGTKTDRDKSFLLPLKPKPAPRPPEVRVRLPNGKLPSLHVIEREPPAGFVGVSLMDLKENQCRFAYGRGPFLFCGEPTQEGSSYCQDCHAIVWVRPERFARAA